MNHEIAKIEHVTVFPPSKLEICCVQTAVRLRFFLARRFFPTILFYACAETSHLSSFSAMRGEGDGCGRQALEEQVGSHLAVIWY